MDNPLLLTLQVLARRAAAFHSLAVAVAMIGWAAPLTALVLGSWYPLLGWFVLIPACGVFFARDAHIVADWRRAILDEWVTGNFDLDFFAAMFPTVRSLPPRTLAAMLDPLPTRRRLGEERRPPPIIRQLLSTGAQAIDRAQIRGAVFQATLYSGVSIVIATALYFKSFWPLGTLVGFWFAHWMYRRAQSKLGQKWVKNIRHLKWTSEEEGQIRSLVRCLDWRSGHSELPDF